MILQAGLCLKRRSGWIALFIRDQHLTMDYYYPFSVEIRWHRWTFMVGWILSGVERAISKTSRAHFVIGDPWKFYERRRKRLEKLWPEGGEVDCPPRLYGTWEEEKKP